uniref:Uncharacterized protein n=1 Tax=Oryza sativa subsp. japonica TaxID=39947 RepID=Q6YZ08_ORYSJ|nr:hypothetical protein [Oryza sativa Japonica Group]
MVPSRRRKGKWSSLWIRRARGESEERDLVEEEAWTNNGGVGGGMKNWGLGERGEGDRGGNKKREGGG